MATVSGAFVYVLLLCLVQQALCIPRSMFYRFGEENGDSILAPTDDGSSLQINLQGGFFPYFGEDHTSLFVNNNGVLSFDGPVSTFTPQSFPLENNRPLIAPYWADVDTRDGGTVYYREVQDIDLLRRARDDIQMAFAGTLRFQPVFLFIVTWDRVGYYNRQNDRIATFQSVLMTDGTLSFTMFLYADGEIQWTTGSASRGVAAQVGFNAGDGERFFSVPGSQTDEIINIDTTTNVGMPGVWIFQVNGDITTALECNEGISGPLAILPRLGSMLGGTPIILRGPCFRTDYSIECAFGDQVVEGVYMESSEQMMAICVSPAFDEPGWKDVTVTVRNSTDSVLYVNSTRFYSIYFEDSSEVQHEGENLLLISRNTIRVNWIPTTLVPMESPGNYLVDVILSRYNLETRIWEELAVLETGVPNDGSLQTDIPSIFVDNNPMVDVYPVAIQVTVSRQADMFDSRRKRQSDGSGGSSLIESLRGVAKQWTSVLYYSLSDFLKRRCDAWCATQPDNIGEEILNSLPPCPPLVQQARSPNNGFVEDTGLSRILSNTFFHSGTDTCFRLSRSSSASGQQCCYDNEGFLVVGPPGGSVDRHAPNGALNIALHFIEDVLPAVFCCQGQFSDCSAYYRKRPSDNGTRYNPPPPACVYGDPHIVSFDGFKYTFNGLGEFVLAETTGDLDEFVLQGRMVQATNPDGSAVGATVFSAIAAREEDADTVQFQLSGIPGDPDALVNGEFVNFIDLPVQELEGVVVTKNDNILSARFDSGAYIEVREENGFLSTVLVSLPTIWQGQLRGLMGNYNGDTADDLSPRDSSEDSLPLDSSLMDIHQEFGITWIIDGPENSIFTYSGDEDLFTYHFPDFEPAYEVTFNDFALEEAANEICGSDVFCRFDIATTENTMVGLSTLIGNQEYEQIVNNSQPIVCTPPCLNGACVATDTCSCSAGYTGERCETPVFTECDSSPCQNNGSCVILGGSYICNCGPDYTGLECQTPLIEGIDPPEVVDVSAFGFTVIFSEERFPDATYFIYINNVIVFVLEGPGVYEAQDLSPSTSYTVTLEIVSEDQGSFISPSVTVRTDDDIDVSGSGSGGPTIPTPCDCIRDIECSIEGRFTGQSDATPFDEELKCTISFGDDLVGNTGSTSNFIVDSSFSVEFLSSGSLSFLTNLGVISRDQTFSSCNVEGRLITQMSDDNGDDDDDNSVAVRQVEVIVLTYIRRDGSFGNLRVEMEDLQESFDEMDFSFDGELDAENECSFRVLLEWLSNQPPLLPEAVCRDRRNGNNPNTIIFFPVYCPMRFGF